jgi:hypothetical protein
VSLAHYSVPVAGVGELVVPALVAGEGERAALRYVEFFTAQIRNPNTRAAYARACARFLAWGEAMGLTLPQIGPVHVAAYVEALGREHNVPTVKQQLAAIRMLFDWLVVGQVVPHNPAASVRGPKHSTSKGKTRMPTRDEAKALLAAIPTDSLVGLRDRALIGTLLFTFARVSACGSRTTTRSASAGGSACTRRAASVTRCRPTTPSRNTSTPTSRRPAWARAARGRCSARRLDAPAD